MSLINSEVKPFKATAYHNGKFVPVSNEDLKGKWSVFVFYPADFTFVCPTELGDLADNYAAFKKLGVEIYSVSTDTHFTHKAWRDTSETIGKVQYPMIADPTLALSRAFEVLIEEEGLAYRGTFVIDPEGKIKVIEVQRYRSRCERAPAQGASGAVRGLASGRGVSRQVDAWRQHALAIAGSGRKDLIGTPEGRARGRTAAF
jgi:peroxiredoxin (alkyl hydroperoxide reductase subunit C)